MKNKKSEIISLVIAVAVISAAVILLLWPPSTESLISDLSSADPDVRDKAVYLLIERGSVVLPDVYKALEGTDSDTQIAALTVIEAVSVPGDGHEEHVMALLPTDIDSVWDKIRIIGERDGHDVIKFILPFLSHSEGPVKCRALYFIDKFGKLEDGFGEQLLKLLEDPDVDTMRSAVEIVSHFDMRESLDNLIALLPKTKQTRKYLPGIIARMADMSTVEKLIKILETGDSWIVRVSSAQTLGVIGNRPDKLARELIIEKLFKNINTELPQLWGEILLVLSDFGEGFEEAKKAVSSKAAFVRLKAILAIYKIAPISAIDYIIRGLEDSEENIVIQSLSLIKVLQKNFPDEVMKAIPALGLLCDNPAYVEPASQIIFNLTGIDFVAAAGADRGETVHAWWVRYRESARWEWQAYALDRYITSLNYAEEDEISKRACQRMIEITGSDFGFRAAKNIKTRGEALARADKWLADFRSKNKKQP